MNDNDFATNLGNRIRELRKNKGVSQLELAYDMDMSMNTISGIELGKISPKIDTLKKIAQKLDIDISELFDFSEHTPKDKVIRKKSRGNYPQTAAAGQGISGPRLQQYRHSHKNPRIKLSRPPGQARG